MNGGSWLSVEEAARICGTDVQRINLWMDGSHIAYARFDTVLMIDSASLFALFERNRIDTIYDDAQQQKKRGRPGKHSELLNTPLDRLGFSHRVVKACRELSIFTTEHLLIHLKRYRFSRLYCVRNFGYQSGVEIFRWLRRNELIDDGCGSRDFKVLYP